MKMEKYSVLMSLYFKEKPEYLRLAIQSMVDQTLKPDEIVIVKDGQITSELQRELDVFVDKYPILFKIVGYENNRGLGLALNYGLEHCKNELVARMDTDDIAKPNRCEKQLMAFEKDQDLSIVESITLFAFFVELKEKKQSRWLFQSQICRIWAS